MFTVLISRQEDFCSGQDAISIAYVEMNWDGSLRFKTEMAKQKFVSLKNKTKSVNSNLKVMFSIEHEYDGIDLYWKYAHETDKFNYINLLSDIRTRFNALNHENQHQYVISITLPAARIEGWELAYDLDQTLEYVDFINVYSMDFYGPWENRYGDTAGPSAPLFCGYGGRRNFNVDHTMQYYVCKSKKPNKFNIAIPFFAMLLRNVTGQFRPGIDVIRWVGLKDGKAEGNAYMSMVAGEQARWKLDNATWDEKCQSSYIWVPETRTYLTFENKRSISAKVKYVNENHLGGVWIWSVDMDDENNSLLNALSSNELCSNSSGSRPVYKC
ncbi:hypothetical protein GCK72_005174 [Caenorhabditis remanei]|uniref:GH18 domain-containing protein n=1 Tax=Caenorhabditis remanei TaxID=31234 RepID=A0A6A5HGI1_CAERE|nr:hypothetical protein GCK72_005174 [Caenorhabditis remanei]KAF1765222.1 hypothetical protein GCK72_005174 [Caenorhabditis remanei]